MLKQQEDLQLCFTDPQNFSEAIKLQALIAVDLETKTAIQGILKSLRKSALHTFVSSFPLCMITVASRPPSVFCSCRFE